MSHTAYKKQKIFTEKQKGFRDGLSCYPKETRGNAITQPRSHPIKKMGWEGRGWVMAFPLISLLFEGWIMTGHP